MPKIDLDALEQTNSTGYPPPFNEPVAGRWQARHEAENLRSPR